MKGRLMGFFTITGREKVLTVVEYLISEGVTVSVDIHGRDQQFSTRIVKLKMDGGHNSLIIEDLYPGSGNSLIESYPDVIFAFEMSGSRCVFATKYLGVNTEYPEFGLIVGFPSTIQVTERRKEERIENDLSESLSVEFTVENDAKVYRLKVASVGASGIGLVIDDANSDLLEKVEVGDTIKDMRFFLPEAVLTVDGTVKHKTRISHGRLEGDYILGIDSGFVPELEQFKERLKKKT